MKPITTLLATAAIAALAVNAAADSRTHSPEYMAKDPSRGWTYTPTDDIIKARAEFADAGLGIFIHWGIYSMFAQGEWYLNYGLTADEYAKAAGGFYPSKFNAREWVGAIKDAGAKYVCFTTRHHDGFSMWHTAQSDYNIVDATPFGRDVLKELADECHRQGIKLHLYYSHIDWTRPDYPSGRTGLATGRDPKLRDWPAYYKFMNNQLTELLTGYGDIGAIWFDGWWDHDGDPEPFDWQLPEQYDLIHSLQPSCLIGNNHHQEPFPGEDIQIFERDLPGENSAGLSGQSVSKLPLETCQTMNGMWGYKVIDNNYKPVKEIVHLLLGAAGKGGNLLLNVGPQPDGSLPAMALDRMKGLGEWMRAYGETVYGTTAGDVPAQPWGVTTRKGDRLFVHVTSADSTDIHLPLTCKVKSAVEFDGGAKVDFTAVKPKDGGGVTLHLKEIPDKIDHIIVLTTK
ncbi:MAG: alpha-L-fucosidase [Muribaculaceae bacterium]|nr:alpha-L-fucosidase [Muribaculaceae bacterium]